MIYVLTGPVRTGKTTALLHWTFGRQDTDGVLCPDDADNKRCFLKLKPQQKFELEVKDTPEKRDIIKIGQFQFLKSAFTAANDYLISVSDKRDYNYLIIDELGKLELKHSGLHDAARTVIKKHEFDATLHVILVIRNTLLHEALAHYGITQFRLITKEALNELK